MERWLAVGALVLGVFLGACARSSELEELRTRVEELESVLSDTATLADVQEALDARDVTVDAAAIRTPLLCGGTIASWKFISGLDCSGEDLLDGVQSALDTGRVLVKPDAVQTPFLCGGKPAAWEFFGRGLTCEVGFGFVGGVALTWIGCRRRDGRTPLASSREGGSVRWRGARRRTGRG